MPIRPENRHRYPRDWHLRRKLVLQRARFRCEWCGVPNGAPIMPRCRWCVRTHDLSGVAPGAHARQFACPGCGGACPIVVLTIAHVHDHRPEAASLLNLAALCQRCHNNHDQADRRRRRQERLERDQLLLF